MSGTQLIVGLLVILLLAVALPQRTASAAGGVTLTATPITWDVVGLDSNNVAVGPNQFPVGTRVCNTGSVAATSVSAVFAWTSSNAYIALQAGTQSTVTLGQIANGSCRDAYFNVEITRNSSAYNQTRLYTVTATDAVTGTVATSPVPRQIYVERLVSQNRNATNSISIDGVAVPAGGTADVVVGRTHTIVLSGATSTNGYEQLEEFLSLPNNAFEVTAVSTTFSADSSPFISSPLDKLYLDGCGWDADPSSPNYRSCVGGAGKAGGTTVVTYTVKILSAAAGTYSLNPMIYDFSGSSYHYNADFTSGARNLKIATAGSVGFGKVFSPKSVTPNSPSTLTFTITNPNGSSISGVNFVDPLPSGLVVAATPAISYSGCGAGTFSPTPTSGATSLSFSGGVIAANSSCVISVNVTSASDGTYVNTTQNLFIEGSTDSGRSATDTLIVKTAAACTSGVTLARWTVPSSSTNPPDLSGGVPTTKSSQVSTATAAAAVSGSTSIDTVSGSGDTSSWSSWGYKNAGQALNFTIDTSQFSQVQMSFAMANPGASNGPTAVNVGYVSSGTFTSLKTISTPASSFTTYTQSFTNVTNVSGNTVFRIVGTGANNDQSGANILVDNVTFTGCATPVPAATISKSFSAATVIKGSTSTLTFTINNTAAGSVALTGLAVSDVLPSGLTVVSGTTSACGGTVTSTASTGTIALTGGSIAAGATCSFSVTVTGATAGLKNNISGFLSSTETGTTTNYATASITVIAPPTIAKSFAPSAIFTGTTSTLSFVITNPNSATALSGIAVSDTLPSGVTTTTTSQSACGGTLTSTAGTGVIALSGATLAAGASCSFSVTVTGATVGTKVNTTGTITSTQGGPGGTATATLSVVDPVASLDLQKEAATSASGPWRKALAVSVGSSVYYRFSLYNSGEVSLSTLAVSDPTIVGEESCTWPQTLAPGDSATCDVGPITAVSGAVVNTATATGTKPGGSTVTSNTSTATYSTTGVTLDKTSSPSSFAYNGQVVTYSYAVTNSGFAPLLGPVTVSDNKVSVTCPPVNTLPGGGNYLDPGETLLCTANYTIQNSDIVAGSITNTATASVDGVSSNSDVVTINYAPIADLSVVKSDSASSVLAGGSVTYTVRVTNGGPSYVTGAVLADPAVSGLSKTAVSCSSASLNQCVSAPTVSQLEGVNGFSLPQLLSGEFFEVQVTATVTATSGSVSNTATVAPPAGTTDPTPGNNTSTDTNTVTPVADLSIVKSDSASSVLAGGSVTYTIRVTNGGPSAVTAALLSDPVVSGLTKTAVSCSGAASNVCVSAPTVSQIEGIGGFGLPLLASGEFFEIEVTATVTATSGSVSNTATVAPPAGTTDPTPGNNTSTDTNTVTPVSDLSVVKTDFSSSVVAGGTVTYTIIVTNGGPSPVTGAVFTDAAATGLSKTAVACISPAVANNVCTAQNVPTVSQLEAGYALPLLASGAFYEVQVTVTVTATSGSVSNTATVAPPAGTTDPNPGNNTSTDTNTVTPVADLSVVKSDSVTSVLAGGTVTYTIRVTNGGPSAVNAASFVDAAAYGLSKTAVACSAASSNQCVSAPTISQIEGGSGYALPLLLSGDFFEIEVTATVTAGAGSVSNTATVAPPAGTTDPNPGNNTSTDTNTVIPTGPVADLGVTKVVNVPSAEQGGAVIFTIRVSNGGPDSVTGSLLSDPAVTGLSKTAVTCSAVPSNQCVNSPSVSQLEGLGGTALPFLASGSFYEIEITATVTAATGSVTNTVAVAPPSGTADPDPNNNTDDVSVTVAPTVITANFVLEKRNLVAVVRRGGTATYVITVTNFGPSTVAGASLRDPVMDGLTKTGVNCVQLAGNQCVQTPTVSQLQDAAGITLPALSVGEFYQVAVDTTVDAASGTVTNIATVTLPPGVVDPQPENLFAEATTPVAPEDPAENSGLPATGQNVSWWLFIAGLLLAGGAMLVGVVRLRNRF